MHSLSPSDIRCTARDILKAPHWDQMPSYQKRFIRLSQELWRPLAAQLANDLYEHRVIDRSRLELILMLLDQMCEL